MDLNIHLSNLTWPGGPADLAPTLAAIARAADGGGVTTLTMMDHWFQMQQLGGPDEPMLEGYTSLGYLAAATERVELGLLVTGVTYRHPGLLAKIVATLDVLSGGRAMLGLGAAWYEEEHLGLGVPFPPVAERFERLEEALQICDQMWSDDNGAYEGKHYRLAETLCNPAPLHRPRILIGGSGEKKTLRFVARYADACNLFATTPAEVGRKIEVLARHCEAEERDPATVAKTIIGAFDPLDDVDAFLSTMEQYAAVRRRHRLDRAVEVRPGRLDATGGRRGRPETPGRSEPTGPPGGTAPGLRVGPVRPPGLRAAVRTTLC